MPIGYTQRGMAPRSDSERQLRERLTARLLASNASIAAEWLARLRHLLSVRENEIFPSNRLLDHIPNLIEEMARHLSASEGESFSANTQVFAKAAELGELRFDQGATIHQMLREYDLLADVLHDHVIAEIATANVDAVDAVQVLGGLRGAIRVLQQQSIDRFVTRYTQLVRLQTSQLRDFNMLISHEIRQPLGVLQVTAELLATADGHTMQFAATLRRNVNQLTGVVSKLERLAGLGDAGSIVEQAVDVRKLVEAVFAELQPMADARGVRLELKTPLPSLIVDPARLELVFTNLIANAIKYSDQDKPERLVVVRPSNSGDERVSVAVEDNGVGLPDGAIRNIFNRFFRVDAHDDRSGFGLGLAIVRECMSAMDGTVNADSVLGEGTTFQVSWPLARLASGRAD